MKWLGSEATTNGADGGRRESLCHAKGGNRYTKLLYDSSLLFFLLGMISRLSEEDADLNVHDKSSLFYVNFVKTT